MAELRYGDIEINGKSYRIDFQSWRGKDIIDFAPRATVPGGSFTMADLGLYQPLVQTDWRHGFGFHWYSDAMGYMNTEGNIDTRQDGLAMMFTKSTSSDTNNNKKYGMTVFNNIPYAWGDAGLRKFSGGSWSEVDMRVAMHTGSAAYKAEVSGAATLNLSVTTHELLNRLLVVFVATKANQPISSLTYNGVTLTQKTSSGSAPKIEMWYLVAPTTGSNTLALTLGGSTDIEMVAYVIYGVDQSTPLDAASIQSTVAGTSSSINITSAANDLVVDGLVLDAATDALEGAGQTNMGEDTIAALGIGTSKEAGAASTTMSWSWTGATDAEQIACNVNRISTQPAVNFALSTATYLFVAVDGDRIKKLTTADVVSEAGLDYNATDYKWLVIHNGYLYAGKDSSNAIHYDNSETLATLQGNSSDTNRIMVGLGPNPTLGALVYNGNLYIRKSDGVWVVGEDRIARRTLDFSAEESSANLRSWAVINGYVVLPLRDRVLQWNGARVSDITPHKINDEFPYVTYGRFTNFVAVGDFLYCTARTNETTYDEALLVFDGVGWHKLMNVVTDSTTDTVTMLAFEAVNNRLWYHLDSTADATYYVPFQNLSTFPYAEFPTTGTHSIISSRLDMGFRRVVKSMANLIVEARGCTTTTFMTIYYSLDGGDWILWDTIKENGILTLSNPGGSLTREFYYMQIRVDFQTATATLSPILEGLTLRFIMRPETKMGYNFAVIATPNALFGRRQDERSSQDIYDELIDYRNSTSPVELVDIFGVSHTGYVTAIQEQPVARQLEREGGDVHIELRYQINFVEV